MMKKLKKWSLYFSEKDGEQNPRGVIKGFLDFLQDDGSTEFVVPGACRLRGYIYQDDRFNDGDLISTTRVIRFEKLGKRMEENEQREFFRAETRSGSQYYMYNDEASIEYKEMLIDAAKGEFDSSPRVLLN